MYLLLIKAIYPYIAPSHRFSFPSRQYSHSEQHPPSHGTPIWSPTFMFVTFFPTSTTHPTIWWPIHELEMLVVPGITLGIESGKSPSITCKSRRIIIWNMLIPVLQMPHVRTRKRTSSSTGLGKYPSLNFRECVSLSKNAYRPRMVTAKKIVNTFQVVHL